jgi:peptide chain release factor 3
MKIEQQRGISVSVTSSVMTFERDKNGITFNLLDTPGHEDFSEDTYRTLTAVDSAVMVIDAAKGIEPQTRKLFEVCRLRNVPIITFVNKVDREGRAVRAARRGGRRAGARCLPDELAGRHGRHVRGHPRFCTAAYQPRPGKATAANFSARSTTPGGRCCPRARRSREEVELAQAGYPEFDLEAYRHGDLTPVYFGSALKNFGVAELIDAIADSRPPPRPQPSEGANDLARQRPEVTGFIFKVQANMDPQHRDRIAFMRLVLGHLQARHEADAIGLGKPVAIHSPILFFRAGPRNCRQAEPGDIIGIPNHGTLRVGDTLSERNDVRFTGLPNFAPEILRRVPEGPDQDQAAAQGAR